METFKTLLPVITTLLGAALSLMAIEYRSTKEQKRFLEREKDSKKNEAIAAIAEVLLLAVSGQVSGSQAKKKVIEIYASNLMLLENGFYKQTVECFDENNDILPEHVEQWIEQKR